METIEINVLLYREEDTWFAQGLEYDIAAQGDTIPEVRTRFMLTVKTRCYFDLMNNQEILQNVKPAPSEFWTLFNEAKEVQLKRSFKYPEIKKWKNLPVVKATSRIYA